MNDAPDHDGNPSVRLLVRQLADDGRAYASAQVAVVKAQAGVVGKRAAIAGVLLAVAATLAFGALIALQIGLILLLLPEIGTGWSIVAVVGGSMAIAGLLGWIGVARARKLLVEL